MARIADLFRKTPIEIINYERTQIGKSIGSGRVEKVDQVIGQRQKHKGKSWRPQDIPCPPNGTQSRFFNNNLFDQPKI